jgi:Major Facilitator Superfamily
MARPTWTPIAFWIGFDIAAVAVTLPELARELPTGLDELYWALAAFGLALAIGTSLTRQVAVGIGLLALGAVLTGLAGGAALLVAGRALQGLGLGLALGRGRGGLPWIAALPAGLLAGGLIADFLGWRWVFFAEALLAAAAFAATMRERADEAEAEAEPGVGARAGAEAAGGGALPFGLLRNPSFAGAALGAFAIGATALASLLFLALYLEGILGHGPAGAALRLLVFGVPAAALAPASIMLCESRGSRWALAPGLALAGVGLLAMRWVEAGENWGPMVLGLVLAGAGTGLTVPALSWTASGVLAARGRAAAALRLKNAFLGIGLAAGALGLGAAFTSNLNSLIKGNFLTLFTGAGDAADFIGTGAAQRASNEALGRFGEIFFVGALEDVLLGAGLVAIFAALAVFILVRPEDFVAAPD